MSRRPLASRDTGWARGAARRLANRGVRPNTISQASMGFAALGGLAFALTFWTGPVLDVLLFVIAGLAVQGRLLCNLFDGMVAVEGGLAERDGPFWNEAPDRVADLLLLGGAGLAAGALWLGLLAGALAVGTAYLRELGRAEGLEADFGGPMAKPQRMAVLTGAAVLAAIEVWVWEQGWAMWLGMWVVVIGAGVTVWLRSIRLIAALEGRSNS